MVTKFMMPSATVINSSSFETDFNDLMRIMETQDHRKKEGRAKSLQLRRRMHDLAPSEKLHLRRARNKIAAQASREKAKVGEDLLTQQLFHLRYEKMKLLLEIEALRKKSYELEFDNECLKFKAQILQTRSINEENGAEASIKHASFVSIPQLKERVLLKIFFMLLAVATHTVNLSAMTFHCWILFGNLHLRPSNNFICLPTQMYYQRATMMPWVGTLFNPPIPNG